MKQMYVCSDTIDGIFSALYDAWKECRNSDAEIVTKRTVQWELFCEYKTVVETRGKAVKLEEMIKKHLGVEAYRQIYCALLSNADDKGTSVFRVLQAARNIYDSRKIMTHLTDVNVSRVFSLSRKVSNESHLYEEFIRFRELDGGVLYSEITPEAQILTCISDHFENRFPLENWAVYDKTHRVFLLHEKQKRSRLVWLDSDEKISNLIFSDEEKKYNSLWKVFFESVSIKERTNKKCQMNHMPLKYRQKGEC